MSVRPMVVAGQSQQAPRPGCRIAAFGKTAPCRRISCLPGARHSQDVKCLALGHADRSSPHSRDQLERQIRAQCHGSASGRCRASYTAQPARRRRGRSTAASALAAARGIAGLSPSYDRSRTQLLQDSLDPVAGGDFVLISVIKLQRLAQGEEVLVAVMAGQRPLDAFRQSYGNVVAHARQHGRVALAGDDRPDDRSCRSRQ